MKTFKIFSMSGAELWSGEASSLADAVADAVKTGASLCCADLSGADLCGADLINANSRHGRNWTAIKLLACSSLLTPLEWEGLPAASVARPSPWLRRFSTPTEQSVRKRAPFMTITFGTPSAPKSFQKIGTLIPSLNVPAAFTSSSRASRQKNIEAARLYAAKLGAYDEDY